MQLIFALLALAWSPAILQGFNWIDTDAMIYTILGLLFIEKPLVLACLTLLCVMTKQNIGLGMAVGGWMYYAINRDWDRVVKYSLTTSILILGSFAILYSIEPSSIYWIFERAKDRMGNPIHIEIFKQFWRTDNNMLKVIVLMNLALILRYPFLIYGLCVLIFAGLGRCGIDFMTHSILAVYVPLYLWSKEDK